MRQGSRIDIEDDLMARGIRDLLLPFSTLFGGVVAARNYGYDNRFLRIKKLPKPVISVGNISVGGSGKTPFVMYLVEKILSLGKKPAVLSRGYKRVTDDLIISCPQKGIEPDVRMVGDEPALISQNFPDIPVAVRKDRYHAGLDVLEKFDVDVFVLDDGFQNRGLHRDLDFVLLRGSLEDLKDYYLPSGRLRDSKRRIRRADLVVLTSHGEWSIPGGDFLRNYSSIPMAGVSFLPCYFTDHAGQRYPLEMIAGREVAAFCAIAMPGQFFSGIESLKPGAVSKRTFRDHHWFDEYDIDEIFGGNEDLIAVTTAKDAMRIFLDEELCEKEEVKQIFALNEKAMVCFGEDHIEAALVKTFGESNE
ncbi:MAG TPA: tetraacyldisaccharide 4'-kinase [Candidatus Acidoferrales bacterium]|nr:tetraacyldisaccharide 4'-kinase [Candidatus Acidoferrales bacterium]